MFFDYCCALHWLVAWGYNHVEIFTATLSLYLILCASVWFAVSASVDFRKFFVFSELAWLSLFTILLTIGATASAPAMLAQALFVLILTACEAVILAAVLLLASDGVSTGVTNSVNQ